MYIKRNWKSWKSAFTLVEMLIVIVIIGILVGVLLPKIMWVTSRARDTKRVADLRNVAMAIQRYKMDTGEYPTFKRIWDGKYVGPISLLSDSLSDYMGQIPKDPQKNTIMKKLYLHWWNVWNFFPNGEYIYQLTYNDTVYLFAKVETPILANYVNDKNIGGFGIWLSCSRTKTISNEDHCLRENYFKPCLSVKKWNSVQTTLGEYTDCTYTDEEQLYYVMKI